jgi:NifU-like N terminal domain
MNALAARSFSRVVARRAALAAPQSSQARLYHENIVEHYENPRNVGSLDKNDDSVGTVSVSYVVLVVASAIDSVILIRIFPCRAVWISYLLVSCGSVAHRLWTKSFGLGVLN